MIDFLLFFNEKYATTFKRVAGSKDELYSDGLLYLRFEDRATINILMERIPLWCEANGEEYDLLDSGDLDSVSYMVYT